MNHSRRYYPRRDCAPQVINTTLLVFVLSFFWEMGAILYTRLAAHAKRDAKGYVQVGGMGSIMAAIGLWGMRLAVPDDSISVAIAWVVGTGLGAMAGLWVGGSGASRG